MIPYDLDEHAAAIPFWEELPEPEIWEYVREASEAYRAELLLYHYSGYSDRETAVILNVPKGMVKSRPARARKELRKIIEYDENAWMSNKYNKKRNKRWTVVCVFALPDTDR